MNTLPPDIEIHGLSKSFAGVPAVQDFSLSVAHGSFTTLLGPSGCGKTTILRMIAGFITPDSGTVRICGTDQTSVPPDKRDTGIVFQDYALFPHMTVESNLRYGLKFRKKTPAECDSAVHEIAGILGLSGLLARYPHELSGGQQQRVAVGRVLVLEPRVLLMDEPLSNLDAKLRIRVREELKDLQSRLGITTLYVTHDREEALSLSDSIAVVNDGRLEQYGTPEQLYFQPETPFCADFAGTANFLKPDIPQKIAGTVVSADFLGSVIRCRVAVDAHVLAAGDARNHAAVVRPEWIAVSAAGTDRAEIPAEPGNCIIADISATAVAGTMCPGVMPGAGSIAGDSRSGSLQLRRGMNVELSVLRSAAL